jgi:hypothetical protein
MFPLIPFDKDNDQKDCVDEETPRVVVVCPKVKPNHYCYKAPKEDALLA